ncbi:glucokinase [Bacillus mesophilus]|uniref:ROK family protein n=1 Tax=Bacillus mesophilus TaxID=1808955 RepID=A0A6M0Q7T9_9BACI|nr:ROK family protein [Bacillus mesophilus]MBM7661763.1 glucokinase [Bacillus mesophilus]NEY72421.1 ROK family protein [Bacillus mesophilus]
MNVIGVDIGGTGVKGMVISEAGTVLKSFEMKTNIGEGKDGILVTLTSVIDELLENTSVQYIGIGTAGRVNSNTGEIVYATTNLPGWQGTNLKQFIEGRYGIPCIVENDANVALVGELSKREQTYPNAVMLTLGTGVGGANVIDHQLVAGAHHQGGEWGHVVLVPFGKPCNCGKRGCMEQYLSGSALLREANSAVKAPYQHGKDVLHDFQRGHEPVQKVVNDYLEYLAIACYNLTVSIDPDVVIIGGGVIDSKELWWDAFLEKLANYESPISILPAQLGNKAGMYGAAKLAMDAAKKRGIVL